MLPPIHSEHTEDVLIIFQLYYVSVWKVYPLYYTQNVKRENNVTLQPTTFSID